MLKRKVIVSFSALLMLAVLATAAMAASKEEPQVPDVSAVYTADEINAVVSSLSENPSFGGSYYEGDTLVINMAGDEFAACQQNQGPVPASSDMKIEYRYVQYPLEYLEQVKDTISDHMYSWGILELDANEVTNQVDVCLKRYDDEIKAAITQFVDDTFGNSDFLHFIDYSKVSIQHTVAYESDLNQQ